MQSANTAISSELQWLAIDKEHHIAKRLRAEVNNKEHRRGRTKTKQYGHEKCQRSTVFTRALIGLKKLKTPQQRQAMSMANTAFYSTFIVNRVKNAKAEKAAAGNSGSLSKA